MVYWTRTLDLSREWGRAKRDDILVSDLARAVSSKLKELPDHRIPHVDEKKKELVTLFEEFARDEGQDDDDFDALMRELYDWGDFALDGHRNGKKVCLIKDC